MSHVITRKTLTLSRMYAYLRGGEPTDQQKHFLDEMRQHAQATQRRLDYQDIDLGLTIPEALEHLVSGRADAEGPYVGNAYYTALLSVIECTGSDPIDVGVYSKPSTFFGLMDDELARLGVPADLLPHRILFADLPDGIPFHIPGPVDGYPAFGHLPLAKAKEVADAYSAVLDRLDDAFTYDAKHLIDIFENEHEEWQTALKYGHTMDTLLFWITG
ncbi:hypothetical protein ACIRNI_09720 [Streptomyces sp. NPDC093546]|uniref:DUF7691 family protein n=1 Tax=Streptomyces sp. NPDC093546 TaxID=3366040 RepID=UPI0038174F57